MADLRVQLNYARDAGPGQRPYTFSYKRSEEEMAESVFKEQNKDITVPVEVLVKDGRKGGHKLDKNSFSFETGVPTALSTEDFYNDDKKVKDVYYKEMAELLKKATGAEHVEMFHHQVRNSERSNATAESGTMTSVQGYAGAVHSDSHPYSAKGIFRMFAQKLGERFHKGRFLYINAWRNISDTPIGNDHLAVCDETSLVKPDDYIVTDFFDKAYSLQQYRLLDDNVDSHRWFYFPNMKKDEVILFKQWDSDPNLEGRLCFHTAFHDDNAPPCSTRESVEARGIAFFPDHEPNTCPSLEVAVPGGLDVKVPMAGEEGRVEPTQLFNYKLEGVYRKEIGERRKMVLGTSFGSQYKVFVDAAIKSQDNGEALSKLAKGGEPYVFNYKTPELENCLQEMIEVPPLEGVTEEKTGMLLSRPKRIANQTLPLLLFAHPGMMLSGSAKLAAPLAATIAERSDAAVASVDYRLLPEHKNPAAVMDMYACLKHLLENCETYKINPQKVCVLGEEAGGFLTVALGLLLAQKGESSLVKLLLPLAPLLGEIPGTEEEMTDEERLQAPMVAAVWKHLSGKEAKEEEMEGKELKKEKEGKKDSLLYPGRAPWEVFHLLPPTLAIDYEFSPTLTGSTRLATRIRAAGRLLEHAVIPGTGLAFAVGGPDNVQFGLAMDAIQKAVKGCLA